MLRVLPRDPPPNEDDLPALPVNDLNELETLDEEKKRVVTMEYAKVLVQRTMQKMQRHKQEQNGMPYVRVRVQPVYTGI